MTMLPFGGASSNEANISPCSSFQMSLKSSIDNALKDNPGTVFLVDWDLLQSSEANLGSTNYNAVKTFLNGEMMRGRGLPHAQRHKQHPLPPSFRRGRPLPTHHTTHPTPFLCAPTTDLPNASYEVRLPYYEMPVGLYNFQASVSADPDNNPNNIAPSTLGVTRTKLQWAPPNITFSHGASFNKKVGEAISFKGIVTTPAGQENCHSLVKFDYTWTQTAGESVGMLPGGPEFFFNKCDPPPRPPHPPSLFCPPRPLACTTPSARPRGEPNPHHPTSPYPSFSPPPHLSLPSHLFQV